MKVRVRSVKDECLSKVMLRDLLLTAVRAGKAS
jgi:hypothetical protein